MIALAVHGGAEAHEASAEHLAWIRQAVETGFATLAGGGSALDAVERAVETLEGSGRFNAGRGARRQLDGVARMDAAIMDGEALGAGAVIAVREGPSPIRAARRVMEHTPHVTLAGEGADAFARRFAPAPDASGPLGAAELYARIYGGDTVGCVALDRRGHLAAGVSTGGIEAMLPGRVGDTPLVGCGLYADDRVGAAACTGSGEHITRIVLAREICGRLAAGQPPEEAARAALARMRERVGGRAGAIVLDPAGRVALVHHGHMGGGWQVEGRPPEVAPAFTRL